MNGEKLRPYRAKRRLGSTPEPLGLVRPGSAGAHRFVVQKHAARRLHHDFRLEWDGVLKSWAVPKGPCCDPTQKRLAVQVEDHPVDYLFFEGIIPPDNYGAGAVIVWDVGTWVPLEDPAEGLLRGKLLFELFGYKLRGVWTLVRTARLGASENAQWLLIKKPDVAASTQPCAEMSVLSGRLVEALAQPLVELPLQGFPKRQVATPAPMLAHLAAAPFSKKGWLFEVKYDGYRMIARRQGPQVTLHYRRGADATALFPEVARGLAAWPSSQFLVDGEVVVHDSAGLPSFALLQQRAMLGDAAAVAAACVQYPATLYVFDLLTANGHDLRDAPLLRRKAVLAKLAPTLGPVRYVEHIRARGLEMLAAADHMQLEGIMAKKADAPYRSGRSPLWLKMPIRRRAKFCVVGFSTRRDDPHDLGALLLAQAVAGKLTYRGAVGSGFTAAQRDALYARLSQLRQPQAPCGGPLLPDRKNINWLTPRLHCQIRYKNLTRDGLVRHAVFERLVQEDEPDDAPPPAVLRAKGPAAVPFTHLDKVFWPQEGYTKGDLVDYYRRVAPLLLPYLNNRPVTLTRFPDGIGGKSFFQKDAPAWVPDWLRTFRLPSATAQRDIDYFVCDDLSGLLYVINLGSIPLHIGASRLTSLGQPDWCILDLDPKTAPFADVVALARHIHRLCDALSLPNFVKTSGSTGLHILIPVNHSLTFDQTKVFAELLARVAVQQHPQLATLERGIAARAGRVYIDTGQNGPGKLLAAPYCVRPVPGALVSTPLAWREVRADLDFRQFTLRSVPDRIRRRGDPLAAIMVSSVDIPQVLKRLFKYLQ